MEPTPTDMEATQIFNMAEAEEEDEAATEIFSPEDLLAKLQEEAGEDATVMMPRTRRRPVRTRSGKGPKNDDSD